MANQIIPLSNSPNQSLTVSLEIDGQHVTVGLKIRFSEMAGYWLMSVFDQSGTLLADSVPLTGGDYPSANVLGQHAFLKIGSAYPINVSGTPMDYAGARELGTDFVLVWSDTPLT